MKRLASRALSVLALLLAGALHADGQRNFRDQNLDLIRFLATEAWNARGHNRWDRSPGFDTDLDYGRDRWAAAPSYQQMDWLDEDIRVASTKRSAVATALNGRRRRQSHQPERPAAIDSGEQQAEVMDRLRPFIMHYLDNVRDVLSQSPEERALALDKTSPTVVESPSSVGGGMSAGGGRGMRRLLALRPLPPNIRTYNRRSLVDTETYPGANRHDPGLLWQGLGR